MIQPIPALLLTLAGLVLATTVHAASCQGRSPNPITDICWSCVFPLTIGGGAVAAESQEDTANPTDALCGCPNPPRVGVPIGFWEPARLVEVTRTPYCFGALGGVTIDAGIPAPHGEVRLEAANTKRSFYQVHWYMNPMLYYLEVLLDDRCIERGSFDIAYMSELDPTWADDELTLLLNPEAFLFSSIAAQAACAADCVAATAGFGSNTLFWCAGCNGSIYPFNGHVQAHVSGVQASSLLAQRMAAKLHREGLLFGSTGKDAFCSYYPQPVMDKTQYKIAMLQPVPQTEKIAGRCCQPFGRSTIDWGAGRQIPYIGEDYSYVVFRKRNCCAGAAPYNYFQ